MLDKDFRIRRSGAQCIEWRQVTAVPLVVWSCFIVKEEERRKLLWLTLSISDISQRVLERVQ
jgi:predicted ATPase